MSFIYKSKRVGKGGRIFDLYKIRTLRENIDRTSSFANKEQYTRFGRFLRKTKFDELPQFWNIIKRDMSFFGPRAEEERTIAVLPEDMKEVLLSVRPGLVDLSSLHFFYEGQILEKSADPHRDYWTKIRPLKFVLQVFYIENRCWLLNLALLYLTAKKILWALITRK